MKQVEVTIMDQSYLLGCPEGGEAPLLDAVARVDKEMIAIRNAGKIKARERIAVLAALNLAHALGQQQAAVQRSTAAATSIQRSLDGSLPESADLDNLLQRIDQAMGKGGQFI
jgi:cell division protein ZapA